MNKQEINNIFNNIRDEYEKIPYPKYQHADLKDIKSKYKCLMDLKGYLEENPLFTRLINPISQTINRLDTKSTILNASERGINKAILPVVKSQGTKPYFLLNGFRKRLVKIVLSIEDTGE